MAAFIMMLSRPMNYLPFPLPEELIFPDAEKMVPTQRTADLVSWRTETGSVRMLIMAATNLDSGLV